MPETPPSEPESRAPWWHWINWLALDAVGVAVVWLGVFAGMTGARLTPVNALVLGAAVWLVYMADRMMDGWWGQRRQGRHWFAGKRAGWLVPLMAVVWAGAVWGALYHMRWVTVKAGVLLWVAVVLYFVTTMAARWRPVSQGLLLMMSSLMVMGLVQGEEHGAVLGLQLWRAVAAGTLLTVIYFGMRFHYDPPPWTLVKKGMGGYLFAVGVALAPFSHSENWGGLLQSAPVVLFAGACALNSLGIRLWENLLDNDPESLLLKKLYPWLLGAVGAGAVAQAIGADEWTRPGLAGIAVCASGFGLLHWNRHRLPAVAGSLAADGWMILVGLAVLFYQG